MSFRQDAEHTLQRIYGRPVEVDFEGVVARAKALGGVPPRTFLTRMLNNLKQVWPGLGGLGALGGLGCRQLLCAAGGAGG